MRLRGAAVWEARHDGGARAAVLLTLSRVLDHSVRLGKGCDELVYVIERERLVHLTTDCRFRGRLLPPSLVEADEIGNPRDSELI